VHLAVEHRRQILSSGNTVDGHQRRAFAAEVELPRRECQRRAASRAAPRWARVGRRFHATLHRRCTQGNRFAKASELRIRARGDRRESKKRSLAADFEGSVRCRRGCGVPALVGVTGRWRPASGPSTRKKQITAIVPWAQLNNRSDFRSTAPARTSRLSSSSSHAGGTGSDPVHRPLHRGDEADELGRQRPDLLQL